MAIIGSPGKKLVLFSTISDLSYNPSLTICICTNEIWISTSHVKLWFDFTGCVSWAIYGVIFTQQDNDPLLIFPWPALVYWNWSLDLQAKQLECQILQSEKKSTCKKNWPKNRSLISLNKRRALEHVLSYMASCLSKFLFFPFSEQHLSYFAES